MERDSLGVIFRVSYPRLFSHQSGMTKYLKAWFKKNKLYLRNKKFILSLVEGFTLLFFSIGVNYFAGLYAAEKASSPVTDIILSNIRLYDVNGIFIYGTAVFWIFIAFLCVSDWKKIPFTIKSIAVFVLIRSLFISLTHIGPFPTHLEIDPKRIVERFSFGADLFFSGHTGLPFLMALVFWQNKYLRVTFIASALIFGAVVLLGHVHYSIDVLAAFFITYSIFHISEYFFKKDRKLFLSSGN